MDKYIGFEIRVLSNLLKREITQDSNQLHQCNTGMHGIIIDYLINHQDKDVFQKDFEDEFSMRRSTASRMLKLMEHNGMIQRVSVNKDARMKKIILTQQARKAHEQLLESRLRLENKLREGITEEELEVFFTVTDKMKHNLGSESDFMIE